MKKRIDVLIIGGGLAGLTSAIHLSKNGIKVTLIEKSSYPRHKVCGEYVSNEIIPYLDSLGAPPEKLYPKKIDKFLFSSSNGRTLTSDLPVGGFGVSRYALDSYLYSIAKENGCEIIKDTVLDVVFEKDNFSVNTEQNSILNAKIVIGAYGKRSNIDRKLAREFIKKKSPWLAVKAHYKGDFPEDLVALHNFKGGYCGVSKVENDNVNVCYLADYKTFKKYKNIKEYQENVLSKNRHLKKLFTDFELVFEKPLTISQIAFDKKKAVEHHILMTGDTAGLIHPLCGNGMAMAIRSAQICSDLIISYFNGTIPSRAVLEKKYASSWNLTFKSRLRTGRLLASLFRNEQLSKWIFNSLAIFPFLLPLIIKKTHGEPVTHTS
ncbi:FAD-dependent oxidoreductase [Flavobacteriaceae bacterium R38]|nr:FAD-dependent oxidoreductase [Flavobacteriaceae bacterium R38]